MKSAVLLLLSVVMSGSLLSVSRGEESTAAAGIPAEKAAAQSVYVCPDCQMMAMQAGACPMCQKPMVQRHLVGVKDGKAMVCDCPVGCTCDRKGMKDGKCACGKAVKTVSAKGMYTCACPGGTCCNTLSDKPGKCACGVPMKKVE